MFIALRSSDDETGMLTHPFLQEEKQPKYSNEVPKYRIINMILALECIIKYKCIFNSEKCIGVPSGPLVASNQKAE